MALISLLLSSVIVNGLAISSVITRTKEIKVINIIIHIFFLFDFLFLMYNALKKKVVE
jgi:hypothetical protein